ncbi:GntR family transcriptional regulator [Falsigemmobacter faecalis]|uniref:GntR family transcriptional regulator n=1 Tax=Falsigemmobacter faecalis TaxID=2488730 RepID=A0A3P3DU18_9RHOB|nr:GntR family transcriptional regulator [Falsigemmobacter faecalis]RRH76198.1 GntR family transcriptional regulator [Falsigemmobacter faecalis]
MSGARPLAALAHQRILAMIIDGRLKSGSLLQEAALGEAFGMSRTPVREAIKRLEGDGLAVVDGRFIRVRSLTPEDIDEIFFLRLELEPLAARAAVRLAPAEITAMETRIRQLMASDTSDLNDLQRATDHDFHQFLARSFGNAAVSRTISELQRRTCVFDYSQVPDRLLRGCNEHLEILELLRAGNPDAVEQALRCHLQNARAAVLQRLRAATDQTPGES